MTKTANSRNSIHAIIEGLFVLIASILGAIAILIGCVMLATGSGAGPSTNGSDAGIPGLNGDIGNVLEQFQELDQLRRELQGP